VESVHQNDLDALFALLVNVNPVLLIHLQVDYVVFKADKSFGDQLFREVASIYFPVVPVVGQSTQMVLVAMTQEVAVARLVLLAILEVVNSDV